MEARTDIERDRAPPGDRKARAVADLSGELARSARLVREQAASIAHYRKMYERASALAKIGVWECDLATEALTWTDGVYDLFELPRGSRIGRAETLNLYEEKSRREMERMRSRAIRDGSSFSIDIRIRTARGNDRWIRLTAEVEQEDGRSVRIFGTKQDITVEKSAQEKVRSLQAELIHVSRRSAMGVMAATLAHELNQPLGAISNYVAGARRTLHDPKRTNELLDSGLEAIQENADRASNIIRNLRCVGKGSSIRTQIVDPNPLIREAASLAMSGVDQPLTVRFFLADDVTISVDPVQIQQVIINLIRNAVEAVQESPVQEIVVATSVEEGNFKIHIDDSGHGIAPGMLDKLFESFVSSRPGGMGVGLSISRTIAEAHGGEILAANREAGGASFCVALPLAGNARNRDPRASILSPGAGETCG
jgi:C4-dicarboxylate-specific signal transduction histidine kinase